MLGAGGSYDRIPYFFSDQFDLSMEYSGHAPHWDQLCSGATLPAASSWLSGSATAVSSPA